MPVIKVACPKCGQKVSGDETFYGRTVNCPICTSRIVFPQNAPGTNPGPTPPPPQSGSSPSPTPSFDEAPPQAAQPQYSAGPAPLENSAAESIPAGAEVPSPLMGTIALVVGILNTVTACIGGIILAPVAIILGHIALARGKSSPVQPAPGQSLAVIGVILGYAGIAFTILVLVAMLIFKQPLIDAIEAAQPPA